MFPLVGFERERRASRGRRGAPAGFTRARRSAPTQGCCFLMPTALRKTLSTPVGAPPRGWVVVQRLCCGQEMSKVAPADASQFGYVDSEPCENPLWCAFTAVTDCVFPCAMFCCCPCKLLKNVPKEGPFTYHHLADATWQPYKILLCNRMQSWLIRHPMSEAYCCCCIRPCITIHDVAAYGTSMIKSFRKECGPVWCDNLKVEGICYTDGRAPACAAAPSVPSARLCQLPTRNSRSSS
jgi:hypothetical protein